MLKNEFLSLDNIYYPKMFNMMCKFNNFNQIMRKGLVFNFLKAYGALNLPSFNYFVIKFDFPKSVILLNRL